MTRDEEFQRHVLGLARLAGANIGQLISFLELNRETNLSECLTCGQAGLFPRTRKQWSRLVALLGSNS